MRFVSLSADGDTARKAIEIGEYDTLQLTCNVLQQEPAEVIAAAREKDMGIIIKNPIASAVYARPRPDDGSAVLWDRAQTLLVPEVCGDLPSASVALRWLLRDPDVHTAIVGTRNPAHMLSNVETVEKRLPISKDVVAELHRRHDQVGRDWPGIDVVR